MSGVEPGAARRRHLPRDRRHAEQSALSRRVIAVPIGILTAIYLVEYGAGRRLARAVTFFVDVMTGVPSIVAGLFIYTVLVLGARASQQSGFAGVARAGDPDAPGDRPVHRGDAEARPERPARGVLRARRAEVAHDPAGRPADRARRHRHRRRCWPSPGSPGETAPLLLLVGLTQQINFNPFAGDRRRSLPTFIWDQISSGRHHRATGRPGLGRRAGPDHHDHARSTSVARAARHAVRPEGADGPGERRWPSASTSDVDIFYGDFMAVEGVSMTVEPRSVTAFIGPSGCGKSTFLRTLNRMHEVIPGARVEGKVLLDDEDIYGPSVDPVNVRRTDRHGLPEAEPVPDDVDLRQRPRRAASWPGAHEQVRRWTRSSRSRCAGRTCGKRSRTG